MENQDELEPSIEHLSDKAKIDYALVQKAVNESDQKAYASLMDRYKDSVFYMLLKMVNDSDDAEDLTIEAFGKAFNRLHQYTPTYAFSTWLFKIATNEALTFIEKNKKSTLTDSLSHNISLENQFSTSSEFNSDDYSGDAIQLKLEKAIATLPEKQRAVFHLKYYEELKYEEISEIMNTSVGALKANYHHAVKKIELFLEND